MKYTTLIALFMLTACAKDPQGLRTPQTQILADCDSVCALIRSLNKEKKTTVTIVDRDVALNLLAEGY
jgi:uncharacterized lipoprotein YajG